MAWHEPGGSQKNPWGKRSGKSAGGDDAFRKFQRKLDNILKGAGSGGGDASSQGDGPNQTLGDNRSQLAIIAGIAVFFWVYQSFFTIDQAERGVIQRFGQFVSVRDPGLGFHLWPLESLTKVNTQKVSSVNYTAKVLTQDINLIDMSLAVQFQLRDPVKYLFQVKDPEQTLRDVGEMAIREIVGRSTLEDILISKREQATTRTKELIQRTLDQYGTGISITSVNLTDIQVPTDVRPSQEDANKAIADKERLVKEAEAYASGILPVAEGGAARQLQEAEAYRAQVVAVAEGEADRFKQLVTQYEKAPRVTRDRLYIEAVENVLGRSQKVVVDTKGNNQMLYLPLDKLIEQQRRNAEPEVSVTAPRASAGANAEQAAQDPRTRVER
ncbi:MAG: FtsH protease activity modulator HflK [Gammaproteobacteria bacterium]|nr:FtsH protease activity modulator HflK [Gammaproteobacteria bacterium]